MFREASHTQDEPTRMKVLRQLVHTPDPEQVAHPVGQALQESPLELTSYPDEQEEQVAMSPDVVKVHTRQFGALA